MRPLNGGLVSPRPLPKISGWPLLKIRPVCGFSLLSTPLINNRVVVPSYVPTRKVQASSGNSLVVSTNALLLPLSPHSPKIIRPSEAYMPNMGVVQPSLVCGCPKSGVLFRSSEALTQSVAVILSPKPKGVVSRINTWLPQPSNSKEVVFFSLRSTPFSITPELFRGD